MYNNLTLIKKGCNHYIDSREVAELVEKRHDHLLRDIRNYIEVMEKISLPKNGERDFFIESSYQNSRNQAMPCFLISKMGAELVASKLTGEKGVMFSVVYVSKFNEMESILKAEHERALSAKSMFDTTNLIQNVTQNIPLTFTATALARIFGMYSMYGNPHAMAVSCIFNEILFIDDEHKIAVSENYETGIISAFRYDEHALSELSNWLFEAKYPREIYGFERTYHVLYATK